MEIYDSLLKPRGIQHDKECHILGKANALKDPSCLICWRIKIEEWIIPEMKDHFNTFWTFITNSFPAQTYTIHTVQAFINITQIYSDLEEDENENKDQTQRMYRQIERLIGSIRYSEKPNQTTQEMVQSIVFYIHSLGQIEANTEQLNNEARNIAWRAERIAVNKKFNQFWEWYKTISSALIPNTLAITKFANLLKLEEEITNQANIEVRQNLNELLDNINHQNNDFDRKEQISQIVDRFIYSQAFRLNDE